MNARNIAALCSCVLDALGERASALNVVAVNAGAMRALNRRFRGRDYATDVLSFAYGQAASGEVRELGEVVTSPDVAVLQAGRWRTSPDAEMKRLIVHGILHLLGYDHEADNGEMMGCQRRLLRRSAVSRCGPVFLGAAR